MKCYGTMCLWKYCSLWCYEEVVVEWLVVVEVVVVGAGSGEGLGRLAKWKSESHCKSGNTNWAKASVARYIRFKKCNNAPELRKRSRGDRC